MAEPNSFDQLVEQWAPILRRAFLDAIAAIRDRVVIARVAEMLERGDVAGALAEVGIDRVAFRRLEGAIEQAYEDGGNYTADRIPALREPTGHRLDVRFDVRNPRAEEWLRDHSSTLITRISEDQVVAVRQHLVAGMEAGQNPRTVALDLVGRINPASGRREGGVIGLTASQEAWVRRYAEELVTLDPAAMKRALRDKRFDRTIAKAIREGQQIPAAKIETMVRAYRTRALRYRAETIGRTEALTSLHAAQIEAFEQAIAVGQVSEAAATKVWRSAVDDRVRDTHRILHGTSVPFRADFVSPSGARLKFPGDPDAPAAETVQCRCAMEIKINFLAGVR